MGFLPLHSNLVLFKFSCIFYALLSLKLYIPIWFYSNDDATEEEIDKLALYIPIWFYSNLPVVADFTRAYLPLHSNLVLFKYRWQRKSMLKMLLYIPIWFYSNPSISYHLFIPLEKHFFVDR